jgi:hypothetical protein
MEIELSTRPREKGLTALGEVDLTPGEIDLEIEELESRVAFVTMEGGGSLGGCVSCGCASCRGCTCP